MGFSNTTFRSTLHLTSVKSALKDATEYLGKRTTRKLGHNTYVRKEGSVVVVRFHKTDIATIREGEIVLTSGGWRTGTTKERINALLPEGHSIWSDLGVWYLSTPKRSVAPYVFQDGCRLQANGSVVGAGDRERTLALRKRVHGYAKAYADLALSGKLNAPGAGDCLLCAVNAPDEEHVRLHLEELYVVPTLLANAAEETSNGWLLGRGLGILWSDRMSEDERKRCLSGYEGKRTVREVTSAIRKYVGRRVGLACR